MFSGLHLSPAAPVLPDPEWQDLVSLDPLHELFADTGLDMTSPTQSDLIEHALLTAGLDLDLDLDLESDPMVIISQADIDQFALSSIPDTPLNHLPPTTPEKSAKALEFGVNGGKKPRVASPHMVTAITNMKKENPTMSARVIRARLVSEGICGNVPSITSINRILRHSVDEGTKSPKSARTTNPVSKGNKNKMKAGADADAELIQHSLQTFRATYPQRIISGILIF